MDSFTLLYLLYSVKLSSQASIYFIWLANSSSRTIAFIAAAVALFAVVPFFHVMVHVFTAKPLSNSTFIAYLCFRYAISFSNLSIAEKQSFPLAILCYKPTRGSEDRVLQFAVVTALDLLDLLIFLFQRPVRHWHGILTADVEHGHLRSEALDDVSVSLVAQDNEQSQHAALDDGAETPRTELHQLQIIQDLGYDVNAINRSGRTMDTMRSVGGRSGIRGPGVSRSLNGRDNYRRSAITENVVQRPESVGWNTEMVHTMGEGQEMEEVKFELGPQQRQQRFFLDLGMSTGTKVENPISPRTPNTITSNDIHPAYRSTFGHPF